MSLHKDEHLTRQLDIIPMAVLDERITIIGAGAVGSWTALALTKMGFMNLEVWDDDKVDTVNLNSQFYPVSMVGYHKATSLRKMVQEFTGGEIDTVVARYTGKQAFSGTVIAAVDSMAARKLIWEAHLTSPSTRAIIDPRMGAEEATLFVMNPMDPKDREDYPKSLYTDEAALQERCTAKATIYTANLLSGLVAKAVKDLLVAPKTGLRTAMWNIRENHLECWNRTQPGASSTA